MSIRDTQQNSLNGRHLAAPRPITRPSTINRAGVSGLQGWVRNPSWPALPAVTSAEQKFVGLYAVWPGDGVGNGGNFFAVNAQGAYTIDFGDGTTTNYTSNTQANYEFNYNAAALANTDAPVTLTDSTDTVNRTAHGYVNGMFVSLYNIVTTTGVTAGQQYYVVNATANSFQLATTPGGTPVTLTNDGTATLLPYKIAVVTITPQAGQNLTVLNMFVKNSTSGLQTYATGWLDVRVSGPNFTSTGFTVTRSTSSTAIRQSLLEQVEIVNPGSMTSMATMFGNCFALQSVPLFDTSLITDMGGMFSGCYLLQSVPLFNTASVTTMSNMFSSCGELQSVPIFNTASVTNMSSMFSGCSSLQSVPLFNTASVTNMSSMFGTCTALQSVPMFNTAAVTNMSSMFNLCYSLRTVPLMDTAAVTNMSNMFNTCTALQSVPMFNTAAVTNMSNMFTNCYALQTVPLFNTALVTDMSSMFDGCRSLQSVPLFNTASVTTMNRMFTGCSALQSVPLLNTASVTNMGSMFSGCGALQTVPALNTTAVSSTTNFSSMFANCSSLTRIQAEDFRFTFSVTGCRLSSAALDEIYTNLPTVASGTITVTNNYGVAGDTPSIATGKGWTVTG